MFTCRHKEEIELGIPCSKGCRVLSDEEAKEQLQLAKEWQYGVRESLLAEPEVIRSTYAPQPGAAVAVQHPQGQIVQMPGTYSQAAMFVPQPGAAAAVAPQKQYPQPSRSAAPQASANRMFTCLHCREEISTNNKMLHLQICSHMEDGWRGYEYLRCAEIRKVPGLVNVAVHWRAIQCSQLHMMQPIR